MNRFLRRRKSWWIAGNGSPLVCSYEPEGAHGGGGSRSSGQGSDNSDNEGGDGGQRGGSGSRGTHHPGVAGTGGNPSPGGTRGGDSPSDQLRTAAEIIAETDPFDRTPEEIAATGAGTEDVAAAFLAGDIAEEGVTATDRILAGLLNVFLPFTGLLNISPESILEARLRAAQGETTTGPVSEGGDGPGEQQEQEQETRDPNSFDALFDEDIAVTLQRLQQQQAALEKSLFSDDGNSITSLIDRFAKLRGGQPPIPADALFTDDHPAWREVEDARRNQDKFRERMDTFIETHNLDAKPVKEPGGQVDVMDTDTRVNGDNGENNNNVPTNWAQILETSREATNRAIEAADAGVRATTAEEKAAFDQQKQQGISDALTAKEQAVAYFEAGGRATPVNRTPYRYVR